jgi:hypothetical protein
MAKIKNRCKREISKRYEIVQKFENRLKTRAYSVTTYCVSSLIVWFEIRFDNALFIWCCDVKNLDKRYNTNNIHQIFIKGKFGYLYSAKKTPIFIVIGYNDS